MHRCKKFLPGILNPKTSCSFLSQKTLGQPLGELIKMSAKVEATCKEEDPWSLPVGIFDLPGEPAIVINGVPKSNPSKSPHITHPRVSDAESQKSVSFGEWLEGREVRKVFGKQYYSGKVTQFDKETGWYRVVYEDGDFEDLDWLELEEILLPLDITIPLKTLATRVVQKSQKPIGNPVEKPVQKPIRKPKQNIIRKQRKGLAQSQSGQARSTILALPINQRPMDKNTA